MLRNRSQPLKQRKQQQLSNHGSMIALRVSQKDEQLTYGAAVKRREVAVGLCPTLSGAELIRC
jgi:hypothetical protein